MAGYTVDKRKVPPQDELQIHRISLLLVDEVEAGDLTVYLTSKLIFDQDDIEFIKKASLRKDRMQNLLSRLTMRGPRAYPELIQALKRAGYEHILSKIEVEDPGVSVVIGERVLAIERHCTTLSDRVSKLEMNLKANAMDAESIREIEQLDVRVSELRSDLLCKIKSLTKENLSKDVLIDHLKGQLGERTRALEEADAKIASLEAMVARMKDEQTKIKSEYNTMKDEQTKMKSEYSNMKDEQTKMKSEYNDIKEQHAKMTAGLAKTKEELCDMKSAMEEERVKMREDMKSEITKLFSSMSNIPAQTAKEIPTGSKVIAPQTKMNNTAIKREEHNKKTINDATASIKNKK